MFDYPISVLKILLGVVVVKAAAQDSICPSTSSNSGKLGYDVDTHSKAADNAKSAAAKPE